ncbi:MAG: hypothetical protein HY892_07920 [Deltaproteobacteria bacterium]|nr:hypothetical protein [Deltaproteobacteria bacterium]
MADIISIDERLKDQREKRLSDKKKRRLDSLRLVMQCTSCPHKCAKCGSQLETPAPRVLSPELPLRLCAGCWEEYQVFRESQSGAPASVELEPYYNAAWSEVWKTWLEYQRRLHRYRSSPEFLQLMVELSLEGD